ncbi:MAG: hypothetical protein QOH93_2884 [Chloroflexia bacterium]|jgi:hypothetical protein|nr:hypothetical protein [Chloroflexia bacterium]
MGVPSGFGVEVGGTAVGVSRWDVAVEVALGTRREAPLPIA